MKFIIIILSLALCMATLNAIGYKMCNTEPVTDPPSINEQKIVNFILKKKLVANKQGGYQRFKALNTESNESVTAKLYLKSNPDMTQSDPLLQYFWTYKDEPTEPEKECKQLDYISQIIKTQKIEDVFFEKCVGDGGGGGAPIPVINAFSKPNGEPLSHYCIFHDCRPKLQKIATLLIKALKILATGPSFYFILENMTADNVFYFDMGPEKYVTITDMKYNAVPITDAALKPWVGDLHNVGVILAKLLTQDCNFVISDKSKASSIELFKQVHDQDGYDHLDIDIGVNPMISTSSTQDKDEKAKMLNDSLYDFILKCLKGDGQFTDPNMALQHNFITKAASTRIDRPSDLESD